MQDAEILQKTNSDMDLFVTADSKIIACPKISGSCFEVGDSSQTDSTESILDIGMVYGREPTAAEMAEAARQNRADDTNLWDRMADSINSFSDGVERGLDRSAFGQAMQGTWYYDRMKASRSHIPHFSLDGIKNSISPTGAELVARGKPGTALENIGGYYLGSANGAIRLANGIVGMSPIGMLTSGAMTIPEIHIPDRMLVGATVGAFVFDATTAVVPEARFGRAAPVMTAEGRSAIVANSAADVSSAGRSWKTFADNGIFTTRTEWSATRPRGTNQTYSVVQRNDIDWGLARTNGPADFVGRTNAEAAARGFAPELSDGSFATLHHIGQDSRGALIEASTRYHGVGKPGQDALHSLYGRNAPHPFYPIDRRAFSVDTREYWQWRWQNPNQ
jgi:A nuclease of the HNH/ENDO VII superfamily with conserved LHH